MNKKSNKEPTEKQSNRYYIRYITKGIATIAVCAMGAYVMQITDGKTGIGWAIIGVIIIWSN